MARVRVSRTMTRKDGKAKGTIASAVSIKTSPNKSTITASRKIIPNYVKSK